jgi:dTDP-4-dehydrorhamnose 3,5-epimerase
MPFAFKKCVIPDVLLIETKTFGDHRGFFRETFKSSEFLEAGIQEEFVQENFSHSKKGTLRGLHFQKPPHAQAKLVAALSGQILDVAVDIRRGSPSYGQHVKEILSRENGRLLFVPAGFAHGFVVLSAEADVFYKVTSEYAPEHDSGILWNDPELQIDWNVSEPLISPKDEKLKTLKDSESPFDYLA